MFSKIKLSLRATNYKLYFSLLFFGFVPTIYTTLRVFFIGQLPSEWSFSIAGQLSWVNLLYEILNEAMILPLFFFIGKCKDEKEALSNCVRTGMLISFGVYSLLSAMILFFAEPLLSLMAADATILEASANYIRIESVANIFAVLCQFALVALLTLGNSKDIYALTFLRLILCVFVDTFFVSSLPVSLNMGVNGIAVSNIIVNLAILAISVYLLSKENVAILKSSRLDFSWTKDFFKVGGISGLESLVRNLAYMVMISRIINVVGEQGTYWVANSFIWGWLLLPVLQLGELIKQETAAHKDNVAKNTLGYFGLTAIIAALWLVTIPLWKPFMAHILAFHEVDKLFELVFILTGFYLFFAFQNIFDSTFYGLGKTSYMLFESLVTNTIYYGIAFVLYATGLWTPSLVGVALLFGIGNVFDSIVSFIAYLYLLKKEKIKIF